MQITLPDDVGNWLEVLSQRQGITKEEALRKAIATEVYIQQEIAQGSTILVQKDNKEIREMVLR